MNICDLPKISYTIAVEKGWWSDPRPLVDLIMLIGSEVSEAIEDYRKHHDPGELWYEVTDASGRVLTSATAVPGGKPCGIPSELADLVIRVADIVGGLEDPTMPFPHKIAKGSDSVFGFDPTNVAPLKGSFVAGLYKVTAPVFASLEENALEEVVPKYDFYDYLSKAVRNTFALAKQCNIDLIEAIVIKTAYNRTRPVKHGGKRI